MHDILIKNGTVIDGTGIAGIKTDVLIRDGKITKIEPNITAKAEKIIDAEHRFVVPGFIDVQNHSDSYWTILDQPDQYSLLSQGITSIIMGNCGASLAPLLSPESIKAIQKWHSLSGINLNWQSMDEFLSHLSSMPCGVNVGTLVGHATLRRGILGDLLRVTTDKEIKILRKSLDDALQQGAFGMSLGLIYAHEVNSSTQELEELSLALQPSNKYLSVHLRSEASHILESIDEVISLANKTSIPIKISHLKIRGKKNWHLFDQVMSRLEIAYHQGINIAFDVYPYTTSWSVLYTYLPKWSYEGGREQILKNLSEPISRRKILDYLKEQGYDFGSIIISEAAGGENFIGKSLDEIARNQEVSPEEAALNVLSATRTQVTIFDHNLSDEHTEIFCSSPLSFISTDGAGYGKDVKKLVHPRCFGAVPRFLTMIREKKNLKWESAIKKLTHDPASFIGIPNRGVLKVDNYADIVIFDPQTINDKADYSNPSAICTGIETVLVNGKIAFNAANVQSLSGIVLKR